jgi:tetratricopeptide (TPR) repeat protein
MTVRRLWRAVLVIALVAVVTSIGSLAVQAQGPDDLDALNRRLGQLHKAGRYAEATAIAKKALALAERKFGPENTQVATALSNLSAFYYVQGRYEEAEPPLNRALAIYEKALGPDHPDVAAAVNNLAMLYNSQGRYAEVEPLFKRALAIYGKGLGPDYPDVATALHNLARLYYDQGRYAEAEPLFKRALDISEKALGPGHPDVASALYNLASVYNSQGRYPEAEPLFKRALDISETVLGSDHPDVATALNNLASLYNRQGRYAEAELLIKRSLAIWEKVLGPDDPDVATAVNNLAELNRAQGRYTEAEPLYKRALDIREKALGPDHPDVATVLNNLAGLYVLEGLHAEAEPLMKRSLAIREEALGADHPSVATAVNNLASLFDRWGRYAEAEPLYKRALDIREKALGPDHPDVGQSLSNVAGLYRSQGRYAEAEPLAERSLAIREKALGPDHPDVATSCAALSRLFWDQGRYAEAEPLAKRSLAIWEKVLGPDHLDVAQALNNLAGLYSVQGRFAEAEPFYKRSLVIVETALGPDNPYAATALINLGELYATEGLYSEAEPLMKRSLAIYEKSYGPDHPDVAHDLNSLGGLALAQRNWAEAAAYWQRATRIIELRTERGLAGSEKSSIKGETVRNSWYFSGLVKMTDRLAPQGHDDRAKQGREMFEKAQWAQASEAAGALAQMAARSAKGNTELAGLVRERQDLVAEWQVKEKLLIAAKSQLSAKRNSESEKSLSDRLASIDTRLATINARFAKDFPDYAALSNPKPASVAEAQALLGPDEALALFLDTDERFKPTPEETFIWLVTKDSMRWVRSELGTKALVEQVATLRCGLDRSGNWQWIESEKRWRATNATCKALRPNGLVDGEVLPFDLSKAHELYKALFGEVEDLIAGKSLLILPSGPLTQLPFHVLLTAEANTKGDMQQTLKHTPWLVETHAITVLPAVSSLKALREHAKTSHATRPFLGIGDPLLEGDPKDEQQRKDAELAKQWQKCKFGAPEIVVASNEHAPRQPAMQQTRGLANRTSILRNAPLPETANELCAVAEGLNADRSDVLLGELATETEIKRRNAINALANYRVIHFATHGAVAGDFRGTTEPGLLLTPPPPEKVSEEDDGYLSASEIAGLKLDADWVILSACNTAAGGVQSAEALSGLARAFFYAGARALLVSHWSVNSYASEALVTETQSSLLADPKMGRAEALRRGMIHLIDTAKEPYQAHPAYWAPLFVVGEGGAER